MSPAHGPAAAGDECFIHVIKEQVYSFCVSEDVSLKTRREQIQQKKMKDKTKKFFFFQGVMFYLN